MKQTTIKINENVRAFLTTIELIENEEIKQVLNTELNEYLSALDAEDLTDAIDEMGEVRFNQSANFDLGVYLYISEYMENEQGEDF